VALRKGRHDLEERPGLRDVPDYLLSEGIQAATLYKSKTAKT